MNQSLYEEHKRIRFEKRRNMAAQKATEYASTEDRLQNFKAAGEHFGVNPMLVAGIYWYKHVCSIEHFIKDVASGDKIRDLYSRSSEPIEGRIQDCQEYLDLIASLAHEQYDEEVSDGV